MKPIYWKLVDLFPTHGDLLENLDTSFNESKPLRQKYSKSHNFHKGQLQRFSQRDRRHGTKWQAFAARRLFTIRRVMVEMTYEMLATKRFPRTWLLTNCMPSGGKWVSDIALPSGTPIGLPCRSPLCFWCYLRRYHDLKQLITSDDEVTMHSNKARKVQGFGMKGPYTISAYECIYPQCFDSKAVWRTFKNQVDNLIRKPPVAIDGSIRRLKGAEFRTAIRVVTPVLRNNEMGLRIAYVHQDSVPPPPSIRMSDDTVYKWDVKVTRHTESDAGMALRHAWPYPVWLLEQSAATVIDVLKYFSGIRTFGTITLKKPIPQVV